MDGQSHRDNLKFPLLIGEPRALKTESQVQDGNRLTVQKPLSWNHRAFKRGQNPSVYRALSDCNGSTGLLEAHHGSSSKGAGAKMSVGVKQMRLYLLRVIVSHHVDIRN